MSSVPNKLPRPLPPLEELQRDLRRVLEEIRDAPTSYSQSNPSVVLGLRSLERQRRWLMDQIDARRKADKEN